MLLLSLPSRSFTSFNLTSHVITKRIVIWVFRRPDVWGNVVAEIFFQTRLCSSACATWHRNLSSDVGFSGSPPFDLRQLLAGDEGFHVEYMWKDILRHNVTIASDYLKHNGVDSVWFSPILMHFGLIAKATCSSMSSSSDSGGKFSYQRKPKTYSIEVVAWVFPEALQHDLPSYLL